jgi:alkaline phosphatase D
LLNFDNLDSRAVATEFVGTSISSGGDGSPAGRNQAALLSENPFVKFHNRQRGYVRCQITPQKWQSDFQVVEYVTRPGAPVSTAASFVVASGKAGVQPA